MSFTKKKKKKNYVNTLMANCGRLFVLESDDKSFTI